MENKFESPVRRFLSAHNIKVSDIVKFTGQAQSTISTYLKKDERGDHGNLPLDFFISLSVLAGVGLDEILVELNRFQLDRDLYEFNPELSKTLAETPIESEE